MPTLSLYISTNTMTMDANQKTPLYPTGVDPWQRMSEQITQHTSNCTCECRKRHKRIHKLGLKVINSMPSSDIWPKTPSQKLHDIMSFLETAICPDCSSPASAGTDRLVLRGLYITLLKWHPLRMTFGDEGAPCFKANGEKPKMKTHRCHPHLHRKIRNRAMRKLIQGDQGVEWSESVDHPGYANVMSPAQEDTQAESSNFANSSIAQLPRMPQSWADRQKSSVSSGSGSSTPPPRRSESPPKTSLKAESDKATPKKSVAWYPERMEISYHPEGVLVSGVIFDDVAKTSTVVDNEGKSDHFRVCSREKRKAKRERQKLELESYKAEGDLSKAMSKAMLSKTKARQNRARVLKALKEEEIKV